MKTNVIELSFYCQVVRHCRHLIIVKCIAVVVFVVVFSKIFKAHCSIYDKIFEFYFCETPHHFICQNCETIFPRSNSLENAFVLGYFIILTSPKDRFYSPTKFCFKCHKFIFVSYAYVRL